MSEIWNFSSSLKDQVQLCISVAREDDQNKWFQEFKHLTQYQKEILNFEKVAEFSQPIDIINENDAEERKDVEVVISKEADDIGVENIEEIVDSIQTEFSSRVDFIIEECTNNHNLLQTLAFKLSAHTIEKLCKHICDKKDISKEFITKYFEFFLPSYLKRSYNSGTLDILVASNKKFPLQFKLLLEILMKDIETPKQVLKDYIQLLSEDDCSNFLIDMSEFDLTSEQFANNIFSIYTAYKDCKKSERIQNYLRLMLIQHSSFCMSDRHFGRLLLAFLQSQKSLKLPINSDEIENIVEAHKSPFKRPCLLLLKELAGNEDLDKSASDDDSE